MKLVEEADSERRQEFAVRAWPSRAAADEGGLAGHQAVPAPAGGGAADEVRDVEEGGEDEKEDLVGK